MDENSLVIAPFLTATETNAGSSMISTLASVKKGMIT
jgi:hypothetical protein